LASGKKKSDWTREDGQTLASFGYAPSLFGLTMDREILYRRIDERVEDMFRRGLMDEVRNLAKRPLSKTARQAVGYKELQPLAERDDRSSGEDAKKLIQQNSRNLAKRQMTWFRKEEGIRWLKADAAAQIDAFLGSLPVVS
jgi:tRNA dimethylallyltransferase